MVTFVHKQRVAEGSTRRFLDGQRNDVPLRKGMVAKFRESHHMIAKLFAAGLKGNDIAARTGYSEHWLSQLHNDPAFQELLSKYRDLDTQLFLEGRDEFYSIATKNMLQAERQLSDKMDEADEEGELLPTRELISIVADRADRFGYGKRETKFNVNVDFADALQRAIKRSGKTIDGSVSEGTGGMKLVGAVSGLPTGREGVLASASETATASRELLVTAPSGHNQTPVRDIVEALPGEPQSGAKDSLTRSVDPSECVESSHAPSRGAQPNGVVPPGAAEPRALRRRLL